MNRFGKRGALLVAILALGMLPRVGFGQTPLYFPKTTSLDTTAYTLRIAGADRYATAGALARVAAINQSTQTGYPFNEPNATADLSAYGFSACPKAVGLAAGDTVADALAASPMKDLANLVIDGSAIDTTDAVMLLTTSGRQGGDDLSVESLSVLNDLRDACGTFDAIVFGSQNAVPNGALNALDSLASTVARVSGVDRFDTAAKIATAVSRAAGPVNVDVFTAANTKTTLTNTVLLAESATGADALSVGPFAAGKNLPVLLTGNQLPVATRNALLAIRPANILVVGGTAAVPDAVATEAATAAGGGAKVTRIAGADRYDTSVKVAQQLYNEYPVEFPGPESIIIGGEPSADYSNVLVGFARSEGSGFNHVGFPDALASAWFLDSASDKATAPKRLAPPIERNTDTVANGGVTYAATIGGKKGLRRAALMLVRQKELPAPVKTHLQGMWPDPTKTPDDATITNDGGFGFIFGGLGAIEQTPTLDVAQAMSGATYVTANRSDLTTKMTPAKVFYTATSFDGAYTSTDGGGVDKESFTTIGDKICVLRNGVGGAQFLAVYQVGSFSSAGPIDYQDDDTTWPIAQSRFGCVDAGNVSSDRAQVLAVGPTGHQSAPKQLDWSSEALQLKVDPPANDDKADTITDGGIGSEQILDGTSSTAELKYTGVFPITYKGTEHTGAEYTLNLTITRSDGLVDPEAPEIFPGEDDRITFTGTITVRDAGALLFNANLEGESPSLASPYKLVGMYSTTTGAGGFRATLTGDTFSITDLVLDGTA